MSDVWTLRATGGASEIDTAEVRRALALFGAPFGPDGLEVASVFDGRAAGHIAPAADLDALADLVCRLPAGVGTYWGTSPLPLDVEQDPEWKGRPKDCHALRRVWLLIDLDPERPDKKRSNATEEEHQAARACAQSVRSWLRERGWPEPVQVDSGNGWQLLYRITLPNDDASKDLLKALLAALYAQYDHGLVEVDTVTYTASRLAKLPGTWARKGLASEERPHRMARLVEVPEPLGVVSVEAIRLVAGWITPAANGHARHDPFRLKTPPADDGRRYALAVLRKECETMAACPVGHLNNTLRDCAFRVGRVIPPLTYEEAEAALQEAAERAGCDNPAKDRSTLRRSLEAGREHPRSIPVSTPAVPPPGPEPWEDPIPLNEIPEAPPFPLEVFPPALRTFAREAAWATSAPVDYVAVPMLAVASAAIGNTRRLAITRKHLQSACLFIAAIGEPGTGKTPALEVAVEPLEEAQRLFARQYAQARREWQADEETADPEPVQRRMLVDDVTPEKLIALLAENGRGLGMVRDELAALLTGMDQYRDKGEGNERQLYLKLWAHRTVYRDRLSNPRGMPCVVYRPYLAIVGGIQPDMLVTLRQPPSKGKPPPDDGFTDRFLFSWPAGAAVTEESWRDVAPATERLWRDAVDSLLALSMEPHEDGSRPLLLRLTESGRTAWQDFTREHAREVNHEDFPDHLKGMWSKLRGYCSRLAVVLHCLREACGEDVSTGVDGHTVEQAGELTGYFKGHAIKVYAAAEADPVVPKARRILAWIVRESRTEFKVRELFKDVKSRMYFPRPEDMDRPLDRLVKHHFLRVRPAPRPQGPGRPQADVYEVNPNTLGIFGTIGKNQNIADCGDSADCAEDC